MDGESKIKNVILQGKELTDNYNETLLMLDDEVIEKIFRNRLSGLKAIIARISRKTQGKDIAYDFETLKAKSMNDLDEIENEQLETLKGLKNLKNDIKAYKEKYHI